MFDRYYEIPRCNDDVAFKQSLIFVVQTVVYFVQQSFMNRNQTPVDSNCLELHQNYTQWITIFDICILTGMVTSVVWSCGLYHRGVMLKIAISMRKIIYVVIGFSLLVLFIWSQEILFT